MEAILVYTTFPDIETAERVVRDLLDKKLIACANLREHIAFYPWEGKTVKEREVGVILKTEVNKWKAVKRFLREVHPYDVPLILRLDVDKLNREYSEWMADVLGLR